MSKSDTNDKSFSQVSKYCLHFQSYACYSSQNKGRWRPLQEREAAYAEARQRIFGNADSATDASGASAMDAQRRNNITRQLQTENSSTSSILVCRESGNYGSVILNKCIEFEQRCTSVQINCSDCTLVTLLRSMVVRQ